MQRKEWKGPVVKRIKLSPAQGGQAPEGETPERATRRQRLGRWMAWGSLLLAVLLVTSVALGATRNNIGASPTPPIDRFNQTVNGLLPGAVSDAGNSRGPMQEATPGAAMSDPSGSRKAMPPVQPGSAPQQQQQSQPWDRMVIRTATLGITVKDVGASLDKVRALAGARGGYVTQTDSRQEGDYTLASITIQVPTAQFDAVVSELRKYGVKPAQESITSSDVTEEYTDLQSQLRNMQATEARVLALMGKAEQINDVLTLDRELRDIRGQIEQIQGRINFLSKRSEMSTITVSLSPESAPAPITAAARTADAWDPAQIAANAWNASLDLLAGVGKVVITGVVFLWWAVPLLLALWIIITRPRRRSAAPASPTGEAS